MIVAIVSSAGGVQPVEEFRSAVDVATAVAEFCASPPSDPASWIGVDTGWSEVMQPLPGARWVYDGVALSQSITELESAKCIRRAEINVRTHDLIHQGFEYPPASGVMFSLSDTAQRNLAELDKLREVLSYPFKMASMDDTVIADVVDATDLHARYLTALTRIQTEYAIGNALKAAVNAATTQAELDAVVDTR